MPDNLRITTPVNVNEGINRTQPSRQGQAVSPIDPSRVNRPNAENQTDQNAQFEFLPDRDSVFSKYVEHLEETPGLSQTMMKIMFDLFSKAGGAQSAKVSSAAMKQLFEAMRMDKPEMLEALMFQAKNQTKFSGDAFHLLREIANRFPNSDFEARLAEFLKAYDGYFSTADTTLAVAADLRRIARQIPRPHSAELSSLSAGLETEQPTENLAENLALLKEKVIPMLSRYVNASNDFGPARDGITLLLYDIARLNTGTREALAEKSASLLDCCRYELNFSEDKLEGLRGLLANQMAEQAQKPENSFFDSLMAFLSEGKKHSGSDMSHALFRDTANALLLDQSVYMPFTHLVLPAACNGKFLFSELWIEKNGEHSAGGKIQPAVRPIHLFLKFEIKSLGVFSAEISLSGRSARMKLSCPAALENNRTQIGGALSGILEANGLTPEAVELVPENSIPIEKRIMKKVYERKVGIDVTV